MAPTTRRSARAKASSKKTKKHVTPEERKAFDAERNRVVRRETSGEANKTKTILRGFYTTGVYRPRNDDWAKNRKTVLAATASCLEFLARDKADLEERCEYLVKELEDMKADREKWKALAEARSTLNSESSNDGAQLATPLFTRRDNEVLQGSLQETEHLDRAVYERPKFEQEFDAIVPEAQAGPQYYSSGPILYSDADVDVQAQIEDVSLQRYPEPYRVIGNGWEEPSIPLPPVPAQNFSAMLGGRADDGPSRWAHSDSNSTTIPYLAQYPSSGSTLVNISHYPYQMEWLSSGQPSSHDPDRALW